MNLPYAFVPGAVMSTPKNALRIRINGVTDELLHGRGPLQLIQRLPGQVAGHMKDVEIAADRGGQLRCNVHGAIRAFRPVCRHHDVSHRALTSSRQAPIEK